MNFLRQNLIRISSRSNIISISEKFTSSRYKSNKSSASTSSSSTKTNNNNETDDKSTGGNGSQRQEDDRENQENLQKHLMVRGSFENVQLKNRVTYMDMVRIFENRDVHRRNHVEFIYAALKNMKHYGVETDLEVYKALVNVLPKGKFIPTNMFQEEFMHYPKQQQCIIDLLEQMEDNGVMPDVEMEHLLINIFGRKGHPVRKFWRMMYWMPKFKNLSPWLLPNPVPDDSFELAKLAVERMCSVDLLSKISIYSTKEIESSIDDTWIISGMSPEQKELLRKHDKNLPIFIEGPYLIWLRNRSLNYFTLRADPKAAPIVANDDNQEGNEHLDDVSKLEIPFLSFIPAPKKNVTVIKSVHEQDDGTIISICVTGTSTKDSLLSWIRLLDKDDNPTLSEIPVLFKLRSVIPNQLVPIEDGQNS